MTFGIVIALSLPILVAGQAVSETVPVRRSQGLPTWQAAMACNHVTVALTQERVEKLRGLIYWDEEARRLNRLTRMFILYAKDRLREDPSIPPTKYVKTTWNEGRRWDFVPKNRWPTLASCERMAKAIEPLFKQE